MDQCQIPELPLHILTKGSEERVLGQSDLSTGWHSGVVAGLDPQVTLRDVLGMVKTLSEYCW